MICSINTEHSNLRDLVAQHTAVFGIAVVVVCLAVFSAIASVSDLPPFIAPAAASIIALAGYAVCRPVFWPPSNTAIRGKDTESWSPWLLVAAATVAAIVALAVGFATGSYAARPDDIPLGSPLAIVAVCIFTGIYEEVLFRGILFGALRKYYDEPIAQHVLLTHSVVVQAVVFAFAHVVGGIIQAANAPSAVAIAQVAVWFVGTLMFGIVMAKLFERTGNIALNCVLHAAYDFVLFAPLAFSTASLRAETITGEPGDLAVFAAQACILAFALLAILPRRKKK